MLASEEKSELERQAQAWYTRLAMFRLKLDVKTSEYLTTDVNEAGSIEINGTALVRTTNVKYLESAMVARRSRNIVRPVAMYGAECWPAIKEVETRLSVMETKMLRWTAGVTRLDRIRNDEIRRRLDLAPIADKLREACLRWYGHVLQASGDTVRKIGLSIDVPGKRPKGWPKQHWFDTLHVDLKVAGIHPDQAFDRVK
ncbi:unnamed protein product [Heligmosomoides polygyrus]|uniref:Transposase n=1 Tax=Heligmosomoides polygyrus TaxID=6339 RepID=A0A183GG56_HELPZ|nr:unnamed protein product [Heligmosomoides polygyrus]